MIKELQAQLDAAAGGVEIDEVEPCVVVITTAIKNALKKEAREIRYQERFDSLCGYDPSNEVH